MNQRAVLFGLVITAVSIGINSLFGPNPFDVVWMGGVILMAHGFTMNPDRSQRLGTTLLIAGALAAVGFLLRFFSLQAYGPRLILLAVIILVIDLGYEALRRLFRRIPSKSV